MIKVLKKAQKRLLDNAQQAMEKSQSRWGKDYWENVYTTLLRKFRRSH